MNKEYTQLVETIAESLLTEINWDKAQEYFDYWGPENVERRTDKLLIKAYTAGSKQDKPREQALRQVVDAFNNIADTTLVKDMEQKSSAGERVAFEVMPTLEKQRAKISVSGPLSKVRPI